MNLDPNSIALQKKGKKYKAKQQQQSFQMCGAQRLPHVSNYYKKTVLRKCARRYICVSNNSIETQN